MQKIFTQKLLIILTGVFIFMSNTQCANADLSDQMYDEIINSYFAGFQLAASFLNKGNDATTRYMNTIRQNFNKEDFKNKTRACFAQYNDNTVMSNPYTIKNCAESYMQNYLSTQGAALNELMKQ